LSTVPSAPSDHVSHEPRSSWNVPDPGPRPLAVAPPPKRADELHGPG
jgi:hypothetical protein